MTLFIPGPLLRPGENEILLMELHRLSDDPAGETRCKNCRDASIAD